MIELSTFVEEASKENSSLKILPLFYTLSVGDLSNKKKIGAWLKQWKKFAKEDPLRIQVEKWRKALKALCSWNGLELSKFVREPDYLAIIVSSICKLVPPHILRDESDLYGQDRLCKVIMTEFEELASQHHNSGGVSVLGLYGLPGSGKTTLSQSLCDRFHAQFSGKVLCLSLPSKPSSAVVVDSLKVVLRSLTDLTDELDLRSISDLGQVRYLLKLHLPQTKCFLVVDNVCEDDESWEAAEAILNAGIGNGSRVMFTARNSDVLCKLLTGHAGKGDLTFATMCVPNIAEDEAVGILLQSAARCSTLSRFRDSEERDVIMDVARNFRFRNPQTGTCDYNPLVMKTLGALLRQYEDDFPKWKLKLDSVATKNAVVISEYREKVITKLIDRSYKELSREHQVIFLDVCLYLSEPGRDSFDRACKWLSIVHDFTEEKIQMELKDLKRWCFISWSASGSALQVHDLYRDFAKVVVKKVDSLYLYLTAAGEEAVLPRRSVKPREEILRIVVEGGCESVGDLQGYSRVRALLVRHCKSLRELKLGSLESLRSLQVDGCGKLTVTDGITEQSRSLICDVRKRLWEWWMYAAGWWQQQQQMDIPRGLGALQFLELRRIRAERVSSVSDCWDLRVLSLEDMFFLKEFPNLSKLTKLETFSSTTRSSWHRNTILEAPDFSCCSELQEVIVDWWKAEFTGFP